MSKISNKFRPEMLVDRWWKCAIIAFVVAQVATMGGSEVWLAQQIWPFTVLLGIVFAIRTIYNLIVNTIAEGVRRGGSK